MCTGAKSQFKNWQRNRKAWILCHEEAMKLNKNTIWLKCIVVSCHKRDIPSSALSGTVYGSHMKLDLSPTCLTGSYPGTQ
jgi:hypothetical protein